MERGKFIVCKASAGAGKTFTLVKTFIALALDAGNASLLQELMTRKSGLVTLKAGLSL